MAEVPPPPDLPPRVRMVVDDPKQLHAQLRSIRREQDVTLALLADRMPVSTRTMARIEKGDTDVRLLHLVEWVRLLGYDIALVHRDAKHTV